MVNIHANITTLPFSLGIDGTICIDVVGGPLLLTVDPGFESIPFIMMAHCLLPHSFIHSPTNLLNTLFIVWGLLHACNYI